MHQQRSLFPAVATPPLKWAGGKRWQVPVLQQLWQPHRQCRLVEPFCGGLAVALGLRPERALLNDINPHLINFYRQLQSGLEITIPMENDADHYYATREAFNRLIEAGEHETPLAAQMFYYLNRTCFNGLCRFNASGFFNTPFGRYKTINYRRDFTEFVEVFREWTFTCQPFSEVVTRDDDFIYADPPYDVEFRSYSQGGFTWDDQIATAEWCTRHQGPVVLVNQATERIIRLYEGQGWDLQFLDGPRSISCNGDRKPVREVLARRQVASPAPRNGGGESHG